MSDVEALHAVLVAQLSTLEILSSMLSLDGELTLAPPTAAALPLLDSLASTSPTSTSKLSAQLPAELVFTILIALTEAESAQPDAHPSLRLTVGLPLSPSPSSPTLTLHQPTWLSRTAHTSSCTALAAHLSSLAHDDDSTTYILDALEWVREDGRRLWEAALAEKEEREQAVVHERERATAGEGALVRVWFWLPSLSTREKRQNIVDWAPEYRLTGFVLAGEPF